MNMEIIIQGQVIIAKYVFWILWYLWKDLDFSLICCYYYDDYCYDQPLLLRRFQLQMQICS